MRFVKSHYIFYCSLLPDKKRWEVTNELQKKNSVYSIVHDRK